MKKKSKILNKLITAMFVVLCVALLCVPAFASDEVLIIPETTVTFDDDGVFLVSQDVLFFVGSTYIVDWNGTEYTCIVQDLSSLESGLVGLGNLEVYGFPNSGEPFVFICIPGQGTALVSIDGSTSATISVYQVVDPSQPVYIQPLVTIPESGTLTGSYSTELVAGETYIVSVNGTEYEVVCDRYSDLDVTGYRLTDGSTFVYLQYLAPVTGGYVIQAPAGAEFAVYQLVDQNAVLFGNLTEFVSSSVGWVGQFVTAVTAQPLLLCFCIVILLVSALV